MQRLLGILFFLSALFAASSAQGESPLTKVVALLQDLKQQLEADAVKEANLYNEYNQWCNSEAMQTKNAMSDLKSKVADLNSFLQEQQAKRNQLDDEIQEAATDLAAKQSDLSGAQNMREKEQADFKERFQVLEESTEELARSLEVLASKGSTGAGTDLVQVAAAIRHALQRSPNLVVTPQEQQTLAAFFQQAQQASMGDGGSSNRGVGTMAQTRPTNVLAPDNYQPPLGFLQMPDNSPNAVLQALQKIKADQEENRDKTLQEEQTAKDNFEQLRKSLSDAIQSFQDEMDTKKGQRALSEESSARSQAELGQATQAFQENGKYLQEVVGQCEQKAREWKERTKLRSDEITAVTSATKIMTSEAAQRMNQIDPRQQPVMFVQTGMQASLKQNLYVGQQVRQILESSGSPVLSLLANRVQTRMAAGTDMGQPDAFGDVRKMIQDMIERLMKEAAEEAEHKEFCDTEMAKSAKAKSEKEKDIKKLSAQLEEMEATVAELTDELEQLSHAMAEMEQMATEATELREKEKTQALLSIKQYQDAQSLIGSAVSVLQEFYTDKPSMLQTGVMNFYSTGNDASTAPETWDEVSQPQEESAGGGNIISLLEVAQSDFQRMESEASTAEAMAEREYTKLMNEQQVQKAVAAKEVEFKSSEKQKLEGSIQRAKSDLKGFEEELEAVNAYIDKLTPECTEQVDSYEERKARREQEIESLKEALQALMGNSV